MDFSLKELDQEQQSAKAFKDAKSAIFTKAVEMFSENYATVAASLNLKPNPDSNELKKMTWETIAGSAGQSQRGFVAKDLHGKNKFVSLNSLDDMFAKDESVKSLLKANKVDKLSQLIPNSKQVDLMAGAVRDAVHDQLSTYNKLVTGGVSAAGSITSNESTGTAMKKAFAGKVQLASVENLKTLAKNHPDLEVMLPEKRILDTGNAVYNNIMGIDAGIAKNKSTDNPKTALTTAVPAAAATAAVASNTNKPKETDHKKNKSNGHPTQQVASATPTSGNEPDMPEVTGKLPTVSVIGTTKTEAIRAGAAQIIYDKVQTQTQTEIEKNIKKEKDKIRNGGDGGWLDVIKGFLLKLFEVIGLGDFVSSFFTPNKNDIKQASHQVATTVSETLTAKDFKYNGKAVPEMNPEELKTAVQSQVLTALQNNKHNYTGFSDENINKLAAGAGAALAEPKNFAELREKTPKIIYESTPEKPQENTLQNEIKKAVGNTSLPVLDCYSCHRAADTPNAAQNPTASNHR